MLQFPIVFIVRPLSLSRSLYALNPFYTWFHLCGGTSTKNIIGRMEDDKGCLRAAPLDPGRDDRKAHTQAEPRGTKHPIAELFPCRYDHPLSLSLCGVYGARISVCLPAHTPWLPPYPLSPLGIPPLGWFDTARCKLRVVGQASHTRTYAQAPIRERITPEHLDLLSLGRKPA